MAGILDPFGYKWWVAHTLANNAQRGTEEGQ
jgi:hypothetical protein